VIQVGGFTNAVAVGGLGRVLFQLLGPRLITSIRIRLIDDGAAPEAWVVTDGRRMAGAYFLATKRGTYQLRVEVTDAAGCQDATGVQRRVTVK
jgi:hypothetical protein